MARTSVISAASLIESLQASSDFRQLADHYANSHGNALDLQTIKRTAEALRFISPRKANNYLTGFNGPLYNLRKWVHAKERLEKLVQGLSSEEPSIEALFSEGSEDMMASPNALERDLIALRRATESAIYSRLNTAFAQTDVFKIVKETAQNLLGTCGQQLNSYAETYEEAGKLEPKPVLASALEMVTAEGATVLAEAAKVSHSKHRRAPFNAAMPVNAMLYLLSRAETPEESQMVIEALQRYGKMVAEVPKGKLTRPELGIEHKIAHATQTIYAASHSSP